MRADQDTILNEPLIEADRVRITNYEDKHSALAAVDDTELKKSGPQVEMRITGPIEGAIENTYDEKSTLNFSVVYGDSGPLEPGVPKQLSFGLVAPDTAEDFATPPPTTQEAPELLNWLASPGNIEAFEPAYITTNVSGKIEDQKMMVVQGDGRLYDLRDGAEPARSSDKGDLVDAEALAEGLGSAQYQMEAAFSG